MEGKRNILVVEDTLSIREYLCTMLTVAGFEVRGCGDGTAALHAAAEKEFHAMITDYHMPNMNGVDVARRFREQFPRLIIIGTSSEDKRRDFLAAGADAFLLKPCRCADIVNIIRSIRMKPV
jgi:two-component system response regulator MprA